MAGSVYTAPAFLWHAAETLLENLAYGKTQGYHGANPLRGFMPCIGVLFALFTPRLMIVILWLFTGWFKGMFGTALWPVLGFFFLPTTLLWYTAVQNWWAGHWGVLQIIGLVIALMIDISPASGKRNRLRRHRRDESYD